MLIDCCDCNRKLDPYSDTIVLSEAYAANHPSSQSASRPFPSFHPYSQSASRPSFLPSIHPPIHPSIHQSIQPFSQSSTHPTIQPSIQPNCQQSESVSHSTNKLVNTMVGLSCSYLNGLACGASIIHVTILAMYGTTIGNSTIDYVSMGFNLFYTIGAVMRCSPSSLKSASLACTILLPRK